MMAGSITKFIFAVAAAFAAAVSNSFGFLAILLAAVLTAFLSWGGNFKDILKIGRISLWFFLLVFLLHLFSGSETALFEFWILKATVEGAVSGLFYGLKLIVFVYSAYMIFFKVDPVELISPFERIAKYAGPFAGHISSFLISFSLALRFLPDLSRQTRLNLMAFRSRGFDFKGGFVKKIRMANLLMVSIFVSTFKRAESVSAALVLKGYPLRYKHAVFPSLKVGLSGIFVFAVAICMIVGGWLSR
ncbi:MAG: energy-coupling factor transporter transmembrane protein EcfT [Candidatus Zixiibacteriota bacterium]|nr:MAG: energy-coupling factor transporter transmembrane protein EcfT [candidate division Zixibacteria bacterium]